VNRNVVKIARKKVVEKMMDIVFVKKDFILRIIPVIIVLIIAKVVLNMKIAINV
jgi:hypothetical protein